MMLRLVSSFLAFLALTGTSFVEAGFEEGEAVKGFQDIPGQYIAVFNERRLARSRQSAQVMATQLTQAAGVRLGFTYDTLVSGFSFSGADDKALGVLMDYKVIEEIVPDGYVHKMGNQTEDLSWGLDRIDDEVGVDGSFEYPDDAGEGVDVYILDTGINVNHEEFTGRLAPDDEHFNTIDYSPYQDPPWNDCDGHGSHVASTTAGTKYGVAKKATLHAVRVLDCGGSGSFAGVIAGMGLVAQQCQARGKKCVANMSLGGGFNDITNRAANAMVEDYGVVLVTSAGNSDADACNYSPASAEKAISVGSTTITDYRSYFSNYGPCMDIFAPGSSILGAWYGCTDCTNTISGTSMASPHVAGVAALVLQDFANNEFSTDPAAIKAQLQADAVVDVIMDVPDDTLNLMLQMNTPFVSHPPSMAPTGTPQPTDVASNEPSMAPTESSAPSTKPSSMPTVAPSSMPSLVTCAADEYKIEIVIETDNDAYETAFTLRDTCDGGVGQIMSVSTYTLEDYTYYNWIHCASFGQFEFTITDSGFDGLLFPGYYEVRYQDEQVAKAFYFEYSDTVVFGDDDCVTPAPTMSHPPSMDPTTSAQPTSTPYPTATPSSEPTVAPSSVPTYYQCPNDSDRYLLIDLKTDSWGYETSLYLTDDCDNEIALDVPTYTFDDHTAYQYQLCLDDHQHTFTISDSYGDGIYSPGYIRLYMDGELLMDDPSWSTSYTYTFLETDGCDVGAPDATPVSPPVTGEEPVMSPITVPPPECMDGEIPFALEIHTDGDSHETSFTVKNSCNNVEIMKMERQGMEDDTHYEFNMCLSGEEHRLTISDSYGDGIVSPGWVKAYYDGDMIVDDPTFTFTYTETFGTSCPAPQCPCTQRRRALRLFCKLRNPFACFL